MKVVVVSHTHWDREWHQPFEVFRLRLGDTVRALLDVLDRDPGFRHFMLDGQTVCLDDVLELHPSLRARLQAHIESGRISIGPWYVLQDEFLVGAEAIVRNLSAGLGNPFGRAMRIGYLPDAFGHIAQMPRILRGFGIETAVVWRGVGDLAPGSQWRWRAPGGAEVLCLFLPGGYGNAHKLGEATLDPSQRVQLWMNGNDHQPADPTVPATLEQLRRAHPGVDIEHASLERAAELVRASTDIASLPAVGGELRRPTPSAPVLSGVWSARSWQKRDHDAAQALLVRFVEPFLAFSSLDEREALAHAWRLLLQCQPHDSICGCSIDEVHRQIDDRLRRLDELLRALLAKAVDALAGARTRDYPFHHAVAVVNPHPFPVTALSEVEVQREPGPFRILGPTGEVAYEIVSRRAADGPELRPAEWLRLRLHLRELPPHGLRLLALEPGAPGAFAAPETTLAVHPVAGGIEIAGLGVHHTVEDEGDRGDLYDFCPTGDAVRSSRDHKLGVHLEARPIGRRVELDVTIDNRATDHRLRARFDLRAPPPSIWTETAFGWLERTTAGTHPVAAATTVTALGLALGGHGLHEVERAPDGAILLTLFRAVGFMSRGDLSTRPGHAGYHVPTPDAQGLGRLHFRYVVAADLRELDAGILAPRALPLERADPADRPLLSVEPAAARLSILKRADDGDGWILRLCGSPSETVTARVRLFRPIRRAFLSDLDERAADEIATTGDELTVAIPANDVVTLRIV